MAKLTKENKLLAIEKLKEMYPDAGCELDYDTVFHLLVAVVLSAQTTDKGVNKVTPALFKDVPDAFAMAKISQEKLETYIKSIGLYKNKAKNLIALSKDLVDKFNGEVPSNYDELLSLPGVGRKTANVMIAEAFHGQSIAVDTHVFRLANRIGFCAEDDVLKTEEALMKAIPKDDWVKMHHCLIWHGRRCCSAKNPDCENCGLNDICKKNGLVKTKKK